MGPYWEKRLPYLYKIALFSMAWSVVSGQWSVVSGQWSVVSGQWSVVSGHLVTSPAYGAEEIDDYRLAPGDKINIFIWGETVQPGVLPVNPNGYIHVPLVGEPVRAVGLTIYELKEVLEKKLAKIIRFPRVTVNVETYGPYGNKVYVLGEVVRPGKYECVAGLRLMDAISEAGGFTQQADLSRLEITRRDGQLLTVNAEQFIRQGDASQNVLLQNDDRIVVRRGEVTVLGAVAQPGRYPRTQEMRLLEAVALAGGTTERSALRDAVVFRENGESLPVDLWALLKEGKVLNNIALHSGDIVFIPEETGANGVMVFGAVKQPGLHVYRVEEKVLDALAAAGGLAENADVKEATILRRGEEPRTIDLEKLVQNGDLTQNALLQPGDVLMVGRGRNRVKIVGQIARPGVYMVPSQATLLDLIAMAGGMPENEVVRKATLVRQGEPRSVDLEKLVRGGDVSQDVLLQAEDVILVGEGRLEVTVVGQVAQPGLRLVPLGTTVVDLLALVGGPSEQADLRGSRVLRAGEPLAVDLEAILRRGDLTHNLELQPGDVFFVPAVNMGDAVAVLGAVAKPGLHVLQENERLLEALTLAGGLVDARKHFEVLISRGDEPLRADLKELMEKGDRTQNYPLEPGDVLVVREVPEEILVLGQVMQPGTYPWRERMRVLDALGAAEGPREQADLRRVTVLRGEERLNVDLGAMLTGAGATADNVLLHPGDIVLVPQADMAKEIVVLGQGVMKPGMHVMRENERLLEALAVSGWAADLMKHFKVTVNRGEKPLEIDLRELLQEGDVAQNIPLERGDVLVVREEPEEIMVLGRVKNPGTYPWRERMRVLDGVAVAGGVAEEAVLRTVQVVRGENRLTLNLEGALTGRGVTPENIPLEPNDVVIVPLGDVEDQVLVLGEVQKPSSHFFREGERFLDALALAGGLTEKADPTKAAVLRKDKKLPVNLEQLLKGGDMTQNLALQPGDVVLLSRPDRVIIFGEVLKPGAYLLTEETTVLDLITVAGGQTEKADLGHLSILRRDEVLRANLERLKEGQAIEGNVILQPGDQVYVPPKGQVFVFGSVYRQGPYTLEPDQRLLDLIGSVGITPTASLREVTLVRQATENGEPVVLTAYLDRAINQADVSQNLLLQPNDLIYIPQQGEKKRPFTWREGLSLLGTLSTAYYYFDRVGR